MENDNQCEMGVFTSIPSLKEIAQIRLCGAVIISIWNTNTTWIPPNEEQIKNLKEMLNIDVIIMDNKEE